MKPVSRRHSTAFSGSSTTGTPNASRTSAEPHFEVTPRLPCLATLTPAAAATNPAAVEMLKVPWPSLPVPQVSTNCSRSDSVKGMWVLIARIACTKPDSSSTVGPRVAIAVKSEAISTSVAAPSSISRTAEHPCSSVRVPRSSTTCLINPANSDIRWPFCPPGQSPLVWKFCPKTKRMKIHEYQAKDILERYGVAVPKGEVANTLEESLDVARRLFAGGAKGVVVKAQIHAGGRGKGGGVKVAKTLAQAEEYATQILGMQLVTHQTGPAGQKVLRLLIEEMSPIARELYLGIVLDRATAKLVFMASQAGGMEIEEVAAKDPDAIVKAYIDPAVGFQPYQARKLAFALGLQPTQINEAVKFMTGLYRVFLETDASLLEINPFITTTDGRLLALDCKINFDDNAIFRHKELKELRDTAEEDPLEVEASKYALNYIKLDGNIACMVNGAGLAMATMDIIQYAGGSPANFLDVGGGANQQQIEHAFEILLSDKNVQAVFINIFGGILRVDTLAQGVVGAAQKTKVSVPVVLRLEGTNVEEGRKILKQSGLNFIIGETMQDAAAKAVKAAKDYAAKK